VMEGSTRSIEVLGTRGGRRFLDEPIGERDDRVWIPAVGKKSAGTDLTPLI
jgi:hypothetical protein